jgi:hypothetical protein
MSSDIGLLLDDHNVFSIQGYTIPGGWALESASQGLHRRAEPAFLADLSAGQSILGFSMDRTV